MNSIPHPQQIYVAPAKKPKVPNITAADRLEKVSKSISQRQPLEGAMFAALFIGRLSGLAMLKHSITINQLAEMAEGLAKELKE